MWTEKKTSSRGVIIKILYTYTNISKMYYLVNLIHTIKNGMGRNKGKL